MLEKKYMTFCNIIYVYFISLFPDGRIRDEITNKTYELVKKKKKKKIISIQKVKFEASTDLQTTMKLYSLKTIIYGNTCKGCVGGDQYNPRLIVVVINRWRS